MGVSAKFNYNALEKAINKDLIEIERKLLQIMQYCGEQFVSDARDALHISPSLFPKGNYKDRTAALRSSIGYFVLRDNEVVFDNVMGLAGGRNSGEGMQQARNTLTSIPPKRGYRLIGVAGMDYASTLESKGYNVITSQEGECFINLGSMLQKFTKQLGKKGITIDFESSF